MAVRLLNDSRNDTVALYCSTTDWAFGPLIFGDDDHDAEERAELFLEWLPRDAREYSDSELEKKYSEFRSLEEELWKQKELVEE